MVSSVNAFSAWSCLEFRNVSLLEASNRQSLRFGSVTFEAFHPVLSRGCTELAVGSAQCPNVFEKLCQVSLLIPVDSSVCLDFLPQPVQAGNERVRETSWAGIFDHAGEF